MGGVDCHVVFVMFSQTRRPSATPPPAPIRSVREDARIWETRDRLPTARAAVQKPVVSPRSGASGSCAGRARVRGWGPQVCCWSLVGFLGLSVHLGSCSHQSTHTLLCRGAERVEGHHLRRTERFPPCGAIPLAPGFHMT